MHLLLPNASFWQRMKNYKELIVWAMINYTRKLEKAAQGKCCPVRSIGPRAWTLRCDVLERADTAVTKLQISPVIVNGCKNGFHHWIQHIFLVIVEGEKIFSKKFFFVFKIWMHFGMSTSVASALTAETIFEIIKCICDVDMCGRGRMGSKSEIFRFFNSGYAHDRNIAIFRCRASRVTGVWKHVN